MSEQNPQESPVDKHTIRMIKCDSGPRGKTETAPPPPVVYLRGEERGDVVQAVAAVFRGDQLQDDELSPLRDGQVDTHTEAGGGGEDQPQTVTLTRETLHPFTGRHVLQHVCLQQTRLLLQDDTAQVLVRQEDSVLGMKYLFLI